MEVEKAILQRRSIRKYSKKEIGTDKIEKILNAGRWAPSGLNNQPWRFKIIGVKEVKEKISKLTTYSATIKNADKLIAIFLNKKDSYNRDKDLMAIGACIQNMMLQAHSLNLGLCWQGEILKNKEKVNKILGVGKENELMAILTLGYAEEKPVSKRKELKKLIL